MANLDDITESLNVNLNIKQPATPFPHEKAVGHKRRSWLENENISPNQSIQSIETGNKLATNRQQTDNKLTTNWQQTGNKLATENQNWQQTGNRTGNTTGNKLATNWQQTGNKLATKSSFSELVGLQRDIVIFICHECKNSRSKTTEPLTLEHISKSLKRNTGAVKTTLQRLEKKRCIIRVEFKNGRSGWSRYEVPDDIYHDVLRNETGNKLATNRQQTGNKLATEPATSPSSSSSSLIFKKTTTTEKLPEVWDFDITPYQQFGFRASHLKQLAQLEIISPVDVEQSLIEFNFDFDNNLLPPIRTGKINLLMGLFRQGNVYLSEHYKSEQEAMAGLMVERAKKKQQQVREEQLIVWEASLSEEERARMATEMPPHLMVLHRTHGIHHPDIKKWLMNYYMNYHITP